MPRLLILQRRNPQECIPTGLYQPVTCAERVIMNLYDMKVEGWTIARTHSRYRAGVENIFNKSYIEVSQCTRSNSRNVFVDIKYFCFWMSKVDDIFRFFSCLTMSVKNLGFYFLDYFLLNHSNNLHSVQKWEHLLHTVKFINKTCRRKYTFTIMMLLGKQS